jgi:hypothetical protein
LNYNQVAAAAASDLACVALGFTADGLITEKRNMVVPRLLSRSLTLVETTSTSTKTGTSRISRQ